MAGDSFKGLIKPGWPTALTGEETLWGSEHLLFSYLSIVKKKKSEKKEKALMERKGDNKVVISNGNNKRHSSKFCPWPCPVPLSGLPLTLTFLEVLGSPHSP